MKDEFSILIDNHSVNMSSSDDRWRRPDNLKCSFNIVYQDHVDNVVPLCGMMRHVHMNVYMFKPIKVTRTNIITTTITHTKKNTTKWFRRKQTVSHKRHEPQPLPTFHVKPTSSCFEETPMYIYIYLYDVGYLLVSAGWPVAMWFPLKIHPLMDIHWRWSSISQLRMKPRFMKNRRVPG